MEQVAWMGDGELQGWMRAVTRLQGRVFFACRTDANCTLDRLLGFHLLKALPSHFGASPLCSSLLFSAPWCCVGAEVRTLLREARDSVKVLLTDKLPDLHALAGALISHETLTAADIGKVLRGEGLGGGQLDQAGSADICAEGVAAATGSSSSSSSSSTGAGSSSRSSSSSRSQ